MTRVETHEVELFERERPRLVGLVYRLLGSVADAEDVVQEVWLRWQRADRSGIERPEAWLTTVTSRVGLDRLRARRRERTEYVGPWLPEPLLDPVVTPAIDRVPAPLAGDPAHAVELADSLTTAFLLVLEQLDPVERLVLLLADVFDLPFARVAEIVGKSEAACRQIAVRARRTVRAADDVERSRPSDEAQRVAEQYVGAALRGDVDALLTLMAPDVVLVSDGGRERHAARRPVVGHDRVSRFVVNIVKRIPADVELEFVLVGGRPGLVVRRAGRIQLVQSVDVHDGRITRVEVIVNPGKLRAIDRARGLSIV